MLRYPDGHRDAIGTRLWLQILPCLKQNLLAFASALNSRHALSKNLKTCVTMKHLILYTVLFLLFAPMAKGQVEEAPSEYILNNIPFPFCPGNPLPAASPNSLNWMASHFFMFTNWQPTGHFVESPFHSTGSTLNPNILGFSYPTLKDYLPSDGWLYIKHDFGGPEMPVSQPYFVLYNKYTGILRVFILQTQLFDQNSYAFITIRHGSGTGSQSNTLGAYNPNGQGAASNLDDNSGTSFIAYNHFSSGLPYWLHADFVLTYDPCSCSIFDDLFIELKLAKREAINLNLNLSGDINGQIKEIKKKSGMSSWSNYFGTTTKLIEFLGKYNTVNPLAKIFKDGAAAYLNPMWGAVKVADILVGMFKDNSPKNYSANLGINLNGMAVGDISWEGTYKTIHIPTPGTNWAGLDPNVLPAYNKPVGIFALVNRPKVTMQLIYHNEGEGCNPYPDDPYCEALPGGVSFRYDLESIEYVVNPWANLTVKEMKVNFLLDYLDIGPFDQGCADKFSEGPFCEHGCGGALFDKNKVKLRITVVFEAPNGAHVVHSAVYQVDLVEEVVENWPPLSPCTGPKFTPQASPSDILTACEDRNGFRDTPTIEYRTRKEAVSLSQDLSFIVAPNPNRGEQVTLRRLDGFTGEATLRIFDMSGKIVLQQTVNISHNEYVTLALPSLQSGMYIAELSSNKRSSIQKMVVRQ